MKQRGFTLIELIVVLVILGILAATAAPLFVNLRQDANRAVLQGLVGSVRSAATLVNARFLIANTDPVDIGNGISVDVVNGFPAATATGLQNAIQLSSEGAPPADFELTITGTTVTIDVNSATTPATCRVTYTEAAVNSVPAITFNDAGC